MNYTKGHIKGMYIDGLSNKIPTYGQNIGRVPVQVPVPIQRPQPSQPYVSANMINKSVPLVEDPIDSLLKKQDSDDKSIDSTDSTNSVKSVGSKSVSNKFVKVVEKFVELDNSIRDKEAEVKQLKTSKKLCEEYILKYLDSVEETSIDIDNGKLGKNQSDLKGALVQSTIKQAIEIELNSVLNNLISEGDITDGIKDKFRVSELAERTLVKIDKMREVKKRTYLKRTFNKKNKKKEAPKKT